jgi:hypothetical protein
MKQLAILIAVAIVLYVGYSQGLPWIQQQMGQDAGAGDTAPARCVHQADRASNTFGDDFGRRFTPGGDADAWAGFVDSVREEIDAARTLCSCPGTACDKAKDAMDRLDGLVGEYDDRFRSGSGMSSNPAGELTRIHGLLNEARALARQGG